MNIVRPDISVVMGSMRIGGAERATLNLINGLSKKGLNVDLVLLNKIGNYLEAIDPKINVVDLKKRKAMHGIGTFKNYLRSRNPKLIFVVQNHIQLMALIAVKLINWKGKIILNEQSTFSKNLYGAKGRIQSLVSKLLFIRADKITAVSNGVANDLKLVLPKLQSKIFVIPNAIITERFLQVKDNPVDHPFFKGEYKVIVSAGRFVASKQFDILIKAFDLYRKKEDAKLILLGDGEEMHRLKNLVSKLHLESEVSFPGFVADPCMYFSKADLFVLSSEYEGLPGVIIEALACGCKVVSTDCDSGPNEILLNGKIGVLCPVGDIEALAAGIDVAMKSSVDKNKLIERANDFHIDKVVTDYLTLFNSLK